MGKEDKEDEIRVEDRRFFDKEGNPVRGEESDATVKGSEENPTSPPPKIDFASFLFMHVQAALVHLGELKDPVDSKQQENLDAARQIIDVLEMLEEKTRGNLNPHEAQYLEGVLFDLRMHYVEKAKKRR